MEEAQFTDEEAEIKDVLSLYRSGGEGMEGDFDNGDDH